MDAKTEAKKQEELVPNTADSSQVKDELAGPSQEDEAEEINKIMNEIKELQQEIETEEKDPAVRSEVIHIPAPPKSSAADRTSGLKTESVRHLSEVRAEKTAAKEDDRESADGIESPESGGELTMSIRGNLTLRLNYGTDQFVKVSFKANELSFHLSDGPEFKLPIQVKQSVKKFNQG